MTERDSLKEKLKADIDKASWNMLEVHHERGAIFVVANEVPLEEIGVSLALDEVTFVKLWMDNNQFYKLDEIPNVNKEERTIEFLIIQPYVLVRLAEKPLS